jgi:hypothetical protein
MLYAQSEGSDPRTVYVQSVVGKVTVGQIFQVSQLSYQYHFLAAHSTVKYNISLSHF